MSDITNKIDDLFENLSGEEACRNLNIPLKKVIKEDTPLSYIDKTAANLSNYIRDVDRPKPAVILTTEEQRDRKLQILENEVSKLAQMTKAHFPGDTGNNLVSGIGQGGDGQTPGSGAVWLWDMDDVSIGTPLNGQYPTVPNGSVLVWSSNENQWVLGAVTLNQGQVETTRDLTLVNAATYQGSSTFSDIGIDPSQLKVQEDLNLAFAAKFSDHEDEITALQAGGGNTYILNADDATSNGNPQITLTDQDDNSSNVKFAATGGASLSVANDIITIDTSAVSGGTTFLGGIDAAVNPETLQASPSGGHYFVYKAAGTAWEGTAVNRGDWAAYSAEDSAWEVLNYTGGGNGNGTVTSVGVSGGVLALAGTAGDPIINLDPSDIVTITTGQHYTKAEVDAKVLNDLADVSSENPINGSHLVYSTTNNKWEAAIDPPYDDAAILSAIEVEKVRNDTQDADIITALAAIESEKVRNDTQDTNIGTNDTDIANLQSKVTELEEQRGDSIPYTIEAIDTQLSSRAGEMHVNNSDPNNITIISLASVGTNGTPVSTPSTGDTVYFSKVVGGTKQEHRYVTTDANNSAQMMNVILVFTTGQTISAGDIFDIHVYPTNTTGATTEYVDAGDKVVQDQVDVLKTDKLDVAGDEMTGRLVLKRTVDANGFKINGVQINGSDPNAALFDVNHNHSGGGDAIRYYGKTSGDSHIQTGESVDAKIDALSASSDSLYLKKDPSGQQNTTDSLYVKGSGKVIGLKTNSGSQQLTIWHPDSANDGPIKYSAKFGAGHWFQTYDTNNANARTDLRVDREHIAIGNDTKISLTPGCYVTGGTSGINYSVSDAHYLKGSVIFNNTANSQLFRINNSGSIKANADIEVDGSVTINDKDFHMDGGKIIFNKPDGEVTIDAREAKTLRILTGTGEDNYFKIANGSEEKFKVTGTGEVSAGPPGSPFLATENNHLTTKKYNDDRYWEEVTSTNATKGINYKGQACIDGTNATPTTGNYQTGALIWSKVSKTLYVKG